MTIKNNKREGGKNITIVWINTNSPNRGVSALAYSTLYLLHTILKDNNVDYSFSIIGNDANGKGSITINSEKIHFTSFSFKKIDSIKGFAKALLFYKYFIQLFKTNYVLDMGEGDSYSDIYGIERFNQLNSTKRVFRLLGKKQLLLPQTIGPFEHSSVIKKAHKSLSKTEVIMARDKQSYDYVKKNIKKVNIYEVIDVAFFMPYTKKEFTSDFTHVGLNISSLLWHGGYTEDNQFKLKVDYKKLTHETIQYFLNQDKVLLHIVPHVVSGNYDIENDYAISREIAEEYNSNKIVLAPFFLDPIDAKNYISGLDFFAGARMHACIAAFSSGVPVFPLAYSRKFNGLFGETLNYPYYGDMKDERNEEIINKLINAFNNCEDLKTKIKISQNEIILKRETLLKERLIKFLDL